MANNEKLNLSNMQKIREKRNITQVKLSLIVGISQQSITYYESSTRTPSLPVALKIAKALGTSVEVLINENDTIAKYYELCLEDQEAVNTMIETLYKKNH